MARNKVLTIKVSPEEKDLIIKASEQDNRSYSGWSRLVLNAAAQEAMKGSQAQSDAEPPAAA